jgi:UDP-2,4-diacetamido-2,4,6-trideoxy-beta-L-altropyranose hydrolase
LCIYSVETGSNPHYEKLQAEVAISKILITLQQNVRNMPELMAWADIESAAGGSTSWELAFMGLPSLVITVAENQAELDRQGVIINLSWHKDLTDEQISFALQKLIGDRPKRQIMNKKGRELVNGNGTNLVASQMINMLA